LRNGKAGLTPSGRQRRTIVVLTWLRKIMLLRKYFCGTIRGTEPYLSNQRLKPSWDTSMNTLPVDRAMCIYSTLADRSETKGARERLSRHLMKKYIEGERDHHRLTVEGLSYLRALDRKIDSRS
jgi:hypothetical protein